MLLQLRRLFLYGSENVLVQFLRYAVVGGLSTIVDYTVFLLCANLLFMNNYISNTISFILGLLTNYFLSRRWVFNKTEHAFGRDFILFAFIGVIGLLISNFILFALIDCRIISTVFHISNANATKMIGKAAAVFIVLFWNFVARKKIVF